MRFRDNDQRVEMIRRVMELTDENTKSGALDRALEHYIADHRNKQRVVDQLDDELVEELSTASLPLERDVTHEVGIDG